MNTTKTWVYILGWLILLYTHNFICINDILFWLTHWDNWWELGYIDNAMIYVNIRYDKYQYSNIQIYVRIQKNMPTLKNNSECRGKSCINMLTVIEIEPISNIKFASNNNQAGFMVRIFLWRQTKICIFAWLLFLDGYLGVLALIGAGCGLYCL